MFFGIYNYDVFAYYGKKILGYDEVAIGSLKELNESGRGQEINESYKFKNGTEVILDGVMIDDNKLVAMYTIKGDSIEKVEGISINSFKGIWNYYQKGGCGKSTEDRKEIKWIMDFDPPKAFDTRLTFNIYSTANDISRGEVGTISFKLDRNKAVKRMVKLKVNEVVDFQGIKYNFTSLSASQMSVVLEGNIKVNSQKDKNIFSYDGLNPNRASRNLNIELWESYVKDGKTITEKIETNRWGNSSGAGGIKFEYEFDGLKPNVQKLILKVVKTEDMKEIGRTIEVNSQTKNVRIVPGTEELIIKDVKEQDGNTVVTFIGEKDIAFETALDIEGKQAITLEETSKIVQINGKESLEKIYKFEGNGKNMSMLFKALTHETYINKQITIYENK